MINNLPTKKKEELTDAISLFFKFYCFFVWSLHGNNISNSNNALIIYDLPNNILFLWRIRNDVYALWFCQWQSQRNVLFTCTQRNIRSFYKINIVTQALVYRNDKTCV